jgi:MFS superfamily sulfate permease-like transporter
MQLVQKSKCLLSYTEFLISVLVIPVILNKIPLATLATILILVGYKLAASYFKHFGKRKIPIYNLATCCCIVTTDLLKESSVRYRNLVLFYLKRES